MAIDRYCLLEGRAIKLITSIDSFDRAISRNHITVLDSIMGSGKTTRIIKWINNHPDEKFLVITPILSEVERFLKSCKDLLFIAPTDDKTSKTTDIMKLLTNGRNIVTTHSLMEHLTSSHISMIKDQGYILICDETLAAVQNYSNVSQYDRSFLDTHTEVNPTTKQVVFKQGHETPADTKSRFNREIKLIDAGRLYRVTDKLYMTELSISLVDATKHTIVLTYLFEGSIMDLWLGFHGKRYQLLPTDSLRATEKELKAKAAKLINWIEPAFSVDWARYSLSANGYNNTDKPELTRRGKQVSNWLKRVAKVKAEDVMYTCYKQHSSSMKIHSFTTSRLSCNLRATNEYSNKTTVIYLIDRYQHRNYEFFFGADVINKTNDLFALSELVQWVWRSAIRDDKPIDLWIPSPRMKRLFLDWLSDSANSEALAA